MRLDGDRLSLKAAQKPPPVLLAKLQRHKAEILSLLRDASRTELDECGIEERTGMAFHKRLQCAPRFRVLVCASSGRRNNRINSD